MMNALAGSVVAVAVRDPELSAAIISRFETAGASVRPILPQPADPVANQSQHLHQAVARLVQTDGYIDVWIQDAHSESPGDIVGLTGQAWEEGLHASLGVAFAGAQAAGTAMLARGSGVVVFLTSVDGFLASAG